MPLTLPKKLEVVMEEREVDFNLERMLLVIKIAFVTMNYADFRQFKMSREALSL